jgi:hypothetical protein
MTRITLAVGVGFALVAVLSTAPAHAAARDRVFVASYGSDTNPCTFGSPCKTFQVAVDAVEAGGEVTAIDSAGFGPAPTSPRWKAHCVSPPSSVGPAKFQRAA